MRSAVVTSGEAQFVTLGIGCDVFAVPVESVHEILGMRPIAHLPEAPAHLAGLIDVRGRTVPAIDLRRRLGLGSTEATENTRILVLEVNLRGRNVMLGLIADRVFEVMPLTLSDLEPAPDIGTSWRSEYIRGVGRRGDGFVVIFDLAKLFSSDESAFLDGGASAARGSHELAPA